MLAVGDGVDICFRRRIAHATIAFRSVDLGELLPISVSTELADLTVVFGVSMPLEGVYSSDEQCTA